MKIAYIHDALARIGGVERILTDKMNYLAEVYGYNIYLITSSQGKHSYPFPLSSKVTHVDIDARFHVQYQHRYPKRLWIKWRIDKRFKKNLKEAIDRISPDIIIGTTYYEADTICRLECSIPKIIESHCAKSFTGANDGIKRHPIIDFFHRFNRRMYYHIIETKSDAIVTLTQGDKKEWKTNSKIDVIPNIITKLPTESCSCTNRRVIATGRLTHQKGFDRLIAIWKEVNRKHPDWMLDIYGNGELKEMLQQQINEANLQQTIALHPPTADIYERMRDSSIFAFSSRYEGFGLVLIEAMANGVPCVSFDCPYGPSDIIEDGKDGFLIPNGNIQAMADKICWLIENEEARKEMGRNAHQSAIRYAPENIMPMWEKLFNEIVKS